MQIDSVSASRLSFVAALLAGAMLLPGAAAAASQCKGMQQDACAADAQCLWVDSYTRKDGRAVASHCKTRSRKKTADQAALDAVRLGQKGLPD